MMPRGSSGPLKDAHTSGSPESGALDPSVAWTMAALERVSQRSTSWAVRPSRWTVICTRYRGRSQLERQVSGLVVAGQDMHLGALGDGELGGQVCAGAEHVPAEATAGR